jgi:hypothetical protein
MEEYVDNILGCTDHSIIGFLNALVVLLDIYVEVINTSVTHPWMLLIGHPSCLKGKHSVFEILVVLFQMRLYGNMTRILLIFYSVQNIYCILDVFEL